MEERNFLVHYKYDGLEGTLIFTISTKANEETFRKFIRYWYADKGKNKQTIIYSWSLIEE